MTISHSIPNQNYHYSTNSQNKSIQSNFDTSANMAVNKILGYGVDSEGFFTNDFNKAAGIPQDYKIYAKGAEAYINHLNENSPDFTNVDLARSLGNVYKLYTQIFDKNISNFTKENLANLPNGFKYDEKSLQVLKTYNQKEMQSLFNVEMPLNEKLQSIFPSSNLNDFSQGISTDDIFSSSRVWSGFNGDIGKNAYTNDDETITKGGVLMAFFSSLGAGGAFMKGKTTIYGKLKGYDDEMSATEVKEFEKFLESNSRDIYYEESDNPMQIIERLRLLQSDLSVEEFKEKWLELNEKSDVAKKSIEAKKAQENNSSPVSKDEESNKDSKKLFTPIQVTSKSETYTDKSFYHNLQRFKNEQMIDMLSILWSQSSNSTFNYDKLKEILVGDSKLDFDNITNSKDSKDLLASRVKKIDIET